MADVLTIAGSPSSSSRSTVLLTHIRNLLAVEGLTTASLAVRDLSAAELLAAKVDGASIRSGIAKVADARAVIVATPIYKTAYAGVLKAFLDLLPQDALASKIVFPIATGGSPSHLLALDYALKPVLAALGAQYILSGLYVVDSQLQYQHRTLTWLDPAVERRLDSALQVLVRNLGVDGEASAAPPFAELPGTRAERTALAQPISERAS